MEAGAQIREYVLEQKIGEGGMGEVWRARHNNLERQVAIKVIREGSSRDDQFRQRFTREAQAMAQLMHPHIVPVHDFFISDGHGFLVMGLIDGGSLENSKHLQIHQALQIAREILDALNFAHQQGVIHRDVKPSNILLDKRGHAYMMDFGIALVAGKERITRLTRDGAAVGTPEYMSPEQITTPGDIDHRTDVYSFGCVLYEMLTGKPPFGSRDEGSTEFELMQAHVRTRPTPIRRVNPKVDKHTDDVVMRSMSKNRDERFSGCGEMSQTLFGTWEPEAAQKVKLFRLLFSFKNRLSRASCWKGFGIVAGFYLLMGVLIQIAEETFGYELADLLRLGSVIGLWPLLAVATKRWHDRGRRAWWFLTCLIPVLQIIPIIWILIETLFIKGQPGTNRYGPDPLRSVPNT